MNNLRPVSLTMVRMNCLDKIVLRHLRGLLEEVSPAPGAYQFVCHLEWVVNDATDNDQQDTGTSQFCKNYICWFSSVFITIQCYLLVRKVMDPEVSPRPLWIKHNRSDLMMSPPKSFNTGAPQGCVLSWRLFQVMSVEASEEEVDSFIRWCSDSFLEKTVIDFRQHREVPHISVNNVTVERVITQKIPRYRNWKPAEF